jgi:hypothetical protein
MYQVKETVLKSSYSPGWCILDVRYTFWHIFQFCVTIFWAFSEYAETNVHIQLCLITLKGQFFNEIEGGFIHWPRKNCSTCPTGSLSCLGTSGAP